MRIRNLLVLPVLFICVSCSTQITPSESERVLFVGNSLTYVGNMPAVYSGLTEANGGPMASDMIVKGGATLAQRVADGSVEKALANRQYTTLVLQERGGDLICSFAAEPCEQSRQAIKALVALAKRNNVHVVLLGTYQSHPAASRQLSQGESSAAAEAGIPYIEVSEKLQHLRGIAPELAWFAADGMHPGKDLALLKAVLLHKALRGTLPSPQALTVRAPIYGINSDLTETLRQAIAPPPLPGTPSEVHYSSDTVEKLLSGVGSS